MVVQGLQTYFKSIPGAVYSGNLREIIREEISRTGGEPTVILDQSAVFHSTISEDYCSNYGGRPRVIRENLKKLVRNIISCGVNLIVVLRGRGWEVDDPERWFWKQRGKFLNTPKGDQSCEDNLWSTHESNCSKITLNTLESKNYTVFSSLKAAHEEVAEIAARQNCLAVLGLDSNYLIYEGIQFYISVENFNFETLDCTIFDSNKLAEHLGLKSYQLPLFATLCGNDVVDPQHLRSFHKQVSASSGDKFRGIAEKIGHTSPCPYQHVKEVVQLINHPRVNEDTVSKSLDMYLKFEKTPTPTCNLTAFADERKRRNEWSSCLHRVFTRQMSFFRISCLHVSGIPVIALLRPLRKEIYGILLHDLNFPVVKEYCMEEQNLLMKKLVPNYVFPKKPPSEHPGLIQLWSETTPRIYYLKWSLFCSSLGGTLTHSVLRSVPKRLLCPTLALYYLHVQVPSLFGLQVFEEQFELEAFLAAAVLLEGNLHESLLENGRRDGPDPHLNHLICCLHLTAFTLQLLNEACGVVVPPQEFCLCNFHDGVLVHHVYRKMKEGAKWEEFFEGCTDKEVLFATLLQIILGDSRENF